MMKIKKYGGFSLLELLISFTILVIILLSINTVLVSEAVLSMKNKDVTVATNLARKVIEDIRNDALNNMDRYLAMESGTIRANLSDSPFSLANLDRVNSGRFIGELTVDSGIANITKGGRGKSTTIFIDKLPSSIGIEPGKLITVIEPFSKSAVMVNAEKVNDPSQHINYEDFNTERDKGVVDITGHTGKRGKGAGGKAYKNNSNSEENEIVVKDGSMVIAKDTTVTIRVYHADLNNKNSIDPHKKLPLTSLTTVLSAPF